MNPNLALALGVMASALPPPPPFTSIAADGWQSTVASPSDLALTPFTVQRAGFNTTGAATTYDDTVLLTKRVRQVFPNQASFTADQVSVSDYVYADDVIVGATNNSTVDSPKPIAAWAMHDRELVAGSIEWEIIAFHRNGRAGRQVACVGVRATDGTNTTAWQYVSATTLSARYEDANAPEVYAGTLDISGLDDDALITLEGKVFPWFGVAASVLDSTTETEWRFGPRYFYRNTTRAAAPNIICVASTGNDSTGVVSTSEATAAATPCLTVGGAIQRAVAVLGNATKDVLSGLEVRVIDGVAMGSVGFIFVNQDAAAIKVTRASTSSRAAAVISMSADFSPYTAGNNRSPVLTESALTFEGVTISITGARRFNGASARRLHAQFIDVAWDFNGASQTTGLMTNSHVSYFGGTVANYAGGLSSAIQGDQRTIRGLTGDMSGGQVDGYCIYGCSLDNGGISYQKAARGFLIYNNTLPDCPGNAAGINVDAATADEGIFGAIVQNLVVRQTTNAGDIGIRVSADSGKGDVVHLVMHHNTCPGDSGFGRWNLLYDETAADARTHILASVKGNLGPQLNTKGDVFLSDGTRLGNFAFHHGVGCSGNFTEDPDAAGGGLSFGQAYGGVSSDIAGGDPLYTDDRAVVASGPTAGSDGGDYTLQAGSPARDLFSEYLLGFDLAGSARPTTGTVDAGAYA